MSGDAGSGGDVYRELRDRGPSAFVEGTGRARYWELLKRERAALRDVETGMARADLVEHVACAACGSDEPVPCFEKDGFAYVRCPSCGTVYVNPQLTEAAMLRFWTTSRAAEAWTEVLLNPAQRTFDEGKFTAALDRLGAAGCAGARLLDVGCSIGVFLDLARARGFDVAGVEPGAGARRVAQELFGLELVPSLEHLRAGASFDVVTAWEVVEHTKDPAAVLRSMRALVVDGGRAVILVGGNAASIANRIMRQASAAFDFARYWYFTPASFEHLLNRTGWRAVHVEQVLDEVDVVESYLRYGDPYQPAAIDEQVLPDELADGLRALARRAGMGYKFTVTARPS